MTLFSTFSKSEAEIIRLIICCPGTSAASVEEALSLDQPHVSRVLKRLLSKGYIRRIKFDSKGKRFLYRYYLDPSKPLVMTYSLIDSEIDNLFIQTSSRHSPFYRLLAALHDLDNDTLAALLKFVQELYSARVNSSPSFTDLADHFPSLSCTSKKLKRRNRLSAFYFHYFCHSRFRS